MSIAPNIIVVKIPAIVREVVVEIELAKLPKPNAESRGLSPAVTQTEAPNVEARTSVPKIPVRPAESTPNEG